MSDAVEDFFGPVISSYSRAQAIDDGVLVEIKREDFDGAYLFKFPIVFTSALFSACQIGQGSDPRTLDARVYDVLWMMQTAARSQGGSDLCFTVNVGRKRLNLRGNIGPGDTPAPVLTVGYPKDF